MNNRLPLLILLFGIILSGCGLTDKVGGACTYLAAVDRAQVAKITPSFVILSHGDNQYEVRPNMFDSVPLKGAWYEVKYEAISQGSCTPLHIQAVKLIEVN
ncbi:hypothetical protein [Paraglaciecola sp. L3A3]|uniref:hypothetical protein n=1 Tax=Paraglaciecola sp. L3A3 TaxID=2686358 RepID=UPI00131D2463|nr:hypothetical protein [Paraglaciecola sp. L3A3]